MDWKVPLSDLSFDQSEEQAVLEVIRSKWLTMGEKTRQFEKEFAAFTQTRHAIAVSSGTAALHIAHTAMGAKSGDNIILPSLTFIATVNTVLVTGATPVFADVESLDTWCISPRHIESLITPETSGIVAVHYAGYPADMAEITRICKTHNLYLIEDCAHGPGTYSNGVHVGNFGQFGCFSFFSNKNLTTAEGGMIITNDEDLAEKARLLRSHGMTALTWQRHKGHASGYDVVSAGYNYRIDEIRSALGLVQLSKLVENNKKRAGIVMEYRKKLANVPNVSIPFANHPGQSSHHIFPVLLDSQIDRDAVMQGMKERRIQTSAHYPAAHLFTYIKSVLGTAEKLLPLTERIAPGVLTLPLFPDMTTQQVEMVVDALAEQLSRQK